jgi:hypothetical protein
MKTTALLLLALTAVSSVDAFSLNSAAGTKVRNGAAAVRSSSLPAFAPSSSPLTQQHPRHPKPASPSSLDGSKQNDIDDGDDGDDTSLLSNLNPLYAGLWLTFLTYAVFLSPGEIGADMDNQMIQAFIENPVAPQGFDPLFFAVFNGLGVMPFVLAQLACPQGSATRGAPAAPFFVASVAMGFGGAGPYLAFAGPPVESKTQVELSWFTANVLENKFVSVGTLLLLASTVVTASGLVADGTSFSTVLSDFWALWQQSKFVSVSSFDLAIITLSAATLIPRDYQLRVQDENGNESLTLGRQIAAGTLFLPILGAVLYCLWRPSLPEE